tara:strand:- start:131 stop:481 length:351 start_codon:yes stop_codon:yes gene_type:complete
MNKVADTVAALKGIPTRQELGKILSEEVCDITFDKLNGDERKMKCSLISNLLPPAEREDKLSQTKIRNLEEKVVVVWMIHDSDPAKSGWRSMRYDRIKKVEIDKYYGNGTEEGANY